MGLRRSVERLMQNLFSILRIHGPYLMMNCTEWEPFQIAREVCLEKAEVRCCMIVLVDWIYLESIGAGGSFFFFGTDLIFFDF